MPSNTNRGLMGALVGANTLPEGLTEQQRQGLISQAARAWGAQLLQGAQSTDVGATFGRAMQAGQGTLQAGADYELQRQRQAEQDALRREQFEAQREAAEALADKRRQAAELARRQSTQKVNALKRNEVGIGQLRQELVQAGFPEAGMWNAKQVESTHKELIERRFEQMFPEPVKSTKPPSLQYKEVGGVPYTFNPATGGMSAIPGAPSEPPAPGKGVQAEIESVLAAVPTGVADQIPGLAEDVAAKLSAIADPVARKMEADRILQSLNQYYERELLGRGQ